MENFNALQPSVQSALVSTTRSAASLASEDLPFHRSLSSSLAARLDRQNARLLALASNLLGSATATLESARAAPSLKDLDSIDGNWRGVIDVVDSLLERADTALDEYTGAVRRMTPDVEVPNAVPSGTRKAKFTHHDLNAGSIEKPQLLFEHVPTNREHTPFRPLLLSKPHAITPLAKELVDVDGKQQFPHPYQIEIEQYQYPASLYSRAEPTPYEPFESTSATFVDTEEAVEEMLGELKQAKEIAIDLEHHDQRSYIGLVSLMQISTRNRDWIVDTLKPWRRKLQCLNEVFADPNIVKVLHGAYMDIVWLQRDLGLYVVGLFDTHYAARALHYQGGSLAFLLKKFANVDAQKQFQLADWRQRPLPTPLLEYARSDTHYLLYIFDCMRNELIENSEFESPNGEGDLLFAVLKKSSETALQRYDNPIYDPELGQGTMGWYKLLAKTPAILTKEQFAVFKAVHQWRDDVARSEDDSLHYVMPNHQVFSIAREMPTNRAALLGIAQPTTMAVKFRADELVSIILQAKEDGKDGPTMLEVLAQIEPAYGRWPDSKQTQSHSVAAFVPQDTFAQRSTTSSTVLPLRSAVSTFWGRTIGQGTKIQKRALSTSSAISSLLIPPTAELVDVQSNDTVLQSRGLEIDGVSSRPMPDEDNDSSEQIVVLKEHGRKRKRDRQGNAAAVAESDSVAAQSNEVSLEDEGEEERLRDKAAQKQARKEAKRAAKLAAPVKNGDTGNEPPFDYASAPSILNPAREEPGRRPERKKQVNPYDKVLDVPKGAPRNPAAKEKAGRTMTYR